MTDDAPGTILVLPGGAYQHLSDKEAEPVAEWIRSLGWDARVVRYPTRARHPEPLDVVRAEVATERAAGARLVGVLGFSAGGHLAGHAAFAPDSTPEQRPDLAVLCYPVVSMLSSTHEGSRHNLLGADATDDLRAATSLERLVTPDAPPVFLWHTVVDEAVLIHEHAYPLATALAGAGVPHEVHVFTEGEHGVAMRDDIPARQWMPLCAAWLAGLAAGS
ncbi:alpha/beta hydrolase [Pseudactinotalea terrae]|uniref:alpha/beta hydrolase n=1 Tax=Pseudactinotalea terrae TaxID=1743262 RepID=UPI0012E21908|nr:alpha/beta hydrolase [Pseudactinotalea terrae]